MGIGEIGDGELVKSENTGVGNMASYHPPPHFNFDCPQSIAWCCDAFCLYSLFATSRLFVWRLCLDALFARRVCCCSAVI